LGQLLLQAPLELPVRRPVCHFQLVQRMPEGGGYGDFAGTLPSLMARGETTVLVVEDEPSIRLLCRVNLELEGFRVVEAARISEARGLLAREPVGVVLLDVHVGGEDGRTLLGEIRGAGSSLPVVLVTGSVEVTEVRQSGADRVLAKPFEPEELMATVRELAKAHVEAHVNSLA
jgi:DNA-binding response OmpR family regulator